MSLACDPAWTLLLCGLCKASGLTRRETADGVCIAAAQQGDRGDLNMPGLALDIGRQEMRWLQSARGCWVGGLCTEADRLVT